MNKKILAIGSIIACVIILLASLSPVVGYNSARSPVKDSPLFSVRSKRAINEVSGTLTCNYLRKGRLMWFPSRNSKTVQIQKMIDTIKNMDDESFNNIVARVIRYLQYQKEFTDTETSEVIQSLYNIRTNSDEIKYIATQEVLGDESVYLSWCWYPGCILLFLIGYIYFLIYFAWMLYSSEYGIFTLCCRPMFITDKT